MGSVVFSNVRRLNTVLKLNEEKQQQQKKTKGELAEAQVQRKHGIINMLSLSKWQMLSAFPVGFYLNK